MELSIVTTLYKSSPYVNEFYKRISKEAQKITNDYEIIFVDDGSPDDSLKKCIRLHQQDLKVTVIELSRNFGHHKAIMTGLEHASGDTIFLIDSDLEEDPELLSQFWSTLQTNQQLDVVYGVQDDRKGGYFERWTGKLYFKLLNLLSNNLQMEKNISTIRLMRKRYVQALLQFKEQGFYLGPICQLAGFNQQKLCFNKHSKKTSSYSLLKKYHLFIDSIITFSSKPLYFIFYAGTLITAASLSYLIYLIIRSAVWGISVKGWTTLIVAIALFGGINIFFIGIISIYLLHIFQETKQRPFTIVRKVYGQNEAVFKPQNPESKLTHEPVTEEI